MGFTTIARGVTLYPNANIQKNSREHYVRSYITFILLCIIKLIAKPARFIMHFIDSYNSTYEEIFTLSYMSGYNIQVSL